MSSSPSSIIVDALKTKPRHIWRARVLWIAACTVSYFVGSQRSASNAIAACILCESQLRNNKLQATSSSSLSLGNNNNNADVVPASSSTPTAGSFYPVHVYGNESPPAVKTYSQVHQELVIMKLDEAHTKKGGTSNKFFVDLAANDAVYLSNTMHMEQNGWDGLCIEGNPTYWYGLAAIRRCKAIGAFVGGTEDGVQVDVVLSNREYGGIIAKGFDNANAKSEAKRNLVTIATVFKEMNVPTVIDYLSLDVEGSEYFVMKDFPFETHKIRFMTIERPTLELMDLLKLYGYQQNPKIFATYGETLWFHPDATKLTAEEVAEISGLKVAGQKCGWKGEGKPNLDCTYFKD